MTAHHPHRCLVIGGARSGKSSWAERRFATATATDTDTVRYLATGYPAAASADDEWLARLARHQQRRPDRWQTLETLAVDHELRSADPRPLLVDCLTLWLTRTLDDAGAWDLPAADARTCVAPAIDGLLGALRSAVGESVLVTNEVGSGIVPAHASGRVFADLLGELNAAVAAVCDEVVLMVAGIPVPVKGGPPPWRNR